MQQTVQILILQMQMVIGFGNSSFYLRMVQFPTYKPKMTTTKIQFLLAHFHRLILTAMESEMGLMNALLLQIAPRPITRGAHLLSWMMMVMESQIMLISAKILLLVRL